MGCKCSNTRALKQFALLPLFLLFLQGCASIAVSRAQEEASTPYCHGLYEILAIESAWRTGSGDLLVCVRGIPVGAVYSEYGSPPDAGSWRGATYSISVPAPENDESAIATHEKWRNIPLVSLPPERTAEGCPAAEPDWQTVDIEIITPQEMKKIWWDEETAARLSRPGEAFFDGYDPDKLPETYSESFNEKQALILRREATDTSQPRLVAYHSQYPHGEPGFHLSILRGAALVWDVVTFPIQILTMGTMDFLPLQCRKA